MRRILSFIIGVNVLFSLLLGGGVARVSAVLTIPNKVMYQGLLLNNAGQPITAAQNIRFSIWSDADYDAADTNGDGTINTGATGYQGFQEEHTITPNARGVFHVEIGTLDTLPNFVHTQHIYLQVELKPVGAPATSYEVIDPDGNTGNTNDRKPIDSAPFASNADTIDNVEIGISAGDIATLSAGGTWLFSQIPGGTDSPTFVFDADNVGAPVPVTLIANQGTNPDASLRFNPVSGTWQLSVDGGVTYADIATTAGPIIGTTNDSFTIDLDDTSLLPTLNFGLTTPQFLRFDVLNDWFEFSNDVNFNQNQAIGLVLEKGTAFPLVPAPVEGQKFYRTDLDEEYVYDGTTWISSMGGDADTLDGLDSTDYLRSNVSDNYTSGTMTFDPGTTLDAQGANVLIDGVDNNTLTLDENDTGGNVALEFGNALGEFLQWNDTLDDFVLSDDLTVQGNVSQEGTLFTLDSDNTGTGNSITIVANQGMENDGIIRYNALMDFWELSNDGGTTTAPIVGTTLSQTLTNKTIDGDDNTLQDIDFSSLKPRTKTLSFVPEYPGFTLVKDGVNNKGTMSVRYSDTGGTGKFDYYRWETVQGTLQDIDVVMKVMLPRDFISFTATPITLTYRTADGVLTNNRIDLSVEDSTGALVTLSGASALTSATFTSAPITFVGVPTFTADGMVVFHIKVSASSAGFADLGEITLEYNGR